MSPHSSCPMLPLGCSHVPCRISEMSYVASLCFVAMSISPMSHVDFKKRPCRRVEFRGQGPYICNSITYLCSADYITLTIKLGNNTSRYIMSIEDGNLCPQKKGS